jgi:hypothetical protein
MLNDLPPLVFEDDTVDLSKIHDCLLWPRRLRVTFDRLKEAVDAVGTNAKRIERYLADTRPAHEHWSLEQLHA